MESDWPSAGAAIHRIRRLAFTNLVLGSLQVEVTVI
jgi:uncharacterized membrane protein